MLHFEHVCAYVSETNEPDTNDPTNTDDNDYNPNGTGGTTGDGSANDTNLPDRAETFEETQANAWEEDVDDSELSDCINSILSTLKVIDNGVGSFIQSISDYSNFVWKLSDKSIIDPDEYTTYAYTSIDLNEDKSITYIDPTKLTAASDIGIAVTLLHEAVHAYLHYKYRTETISKSYVFLFEANYSEKWGHEKSQKGNATDC